MGTTAQKLTYLQETKNDIISTLTDKLSGFITFDASKETFRNLCTKYVKAIGTTSIGIQAFYDCTGLTSIVIPDSVTSIGEQAFLNCTGLSSVTVGNNVTRINGYAFLDCVHLSSFTLTALTPPTLGTDVFAGTGNFPIYVPAESVDTYKSATGWSEYASRIQAIQ